MIDLTSEDWGFLGAHQRLVQYLVELPVPARGRNRCARLVLYRQYASNVLAMAHDTDDKAKPHTPLPSGGFADSKSFRENTIASMISHDIELPGGLETYH